ncbi:protein starmaker-like isoform X2 [Penaeus indicus]|uniref:protein starmaker-like isoform X2 n=1 Tax=Penaeus indicus TaxID=29960 RepID=UPI00300D245A
MASPTDEAACSGDGKNEAHGMYASMMESVGIDIIDEMETVDETEPEPEDRPESLNDLDIQEDGPVNEAKITDDTKSSESDEEEVKERLITNSLGNVLSMFFRKGNNGALKTETLQGQQCHSNSSNKSGNTGTDDVNDGINEAAADASIPVEQKHLTEDKEQVEDQTGKNIKTDDSNLQEAASDSNSVIGQKEGIECMKESSHGIADKYGSYIKVTLSGYFLCEVCLSEMNGLPSLELHVSGMKHLKRVAVYEKNKALICQDGRNQAVQQMLEQKHSEDVKSKDNMTKSNNRSKRDGEREKIRYREGDRSRDREKESGPYRGEDRNRDREREGGQYRGGDRSRVGERESNLYRDGGRDRERDRNRSIETERFGSRDRDRNRFGSKDRYRNVSQERDRYRDADTAKGGYRNGNRDRDRDRYRDSRDGDRYGSRDRDRVGSRDRDRVGSRDRDRVGSRDRDRYGGLSRDRDRYRGGSGSRDGVRYRGRSGSRDKGGYRDRSRSRDRDRYMGGSIGRNRDRDRNISRERNFPYSDSSEPPYDRAGYNDGGFDYQDQTQRRYDSPYRRGSPVHQGNASLSYGNYTYSRRGDSPYQSTENSFYQRRASLHHGGESSYQERGRLNDIQGAPQSQFQRQEQAPAAPVFTAADYQLNFPHTNPQAPKEDVLQGAVGHWLMHMASCSMESKEDVDMGLKIISLFLKPLKEYSCRLQDTSSSDLIAATEVNLRSLREYNLSSKQTIMDFLLKNSAQSTLRQTQNEQQHYDY